MIYYQTIDSRVAEPICHRIFEEQQFEVFGQHIPRNADTLSLAAFDDRAVIGVIVARLEYDTVDVTQLVVQKEYRKQGIGSQLLNEIERIAKEKGVINLTLTTQDFQGSSFYEQQGYKIYGQLIDMPRAGETRIYFYKNLQS